MQCEPYILSKKGLTHQGLKHEPTSHFQQNPAEVKMFNDVKKFH